MRNLFKKGLSAAIALSMAASMAVMIPITASAENGTWTGTNGSSGTWTFENGTLTVLGTGDLTGCGFPWKSAAQETATEIVVGEGITVLPQQAFKDFANVTNITLSEGLVTMADNCFTNCVGLTEVTLPASLESCTTRSFFKCWNIRTVNLASGAEHLKLQDGVLYNSDMTTLMYYPHDKLGDTFTIPSSVTFIDGMYGQNHLKSLTIPSTVERIGDWAFAYLTNLEELTIEDGVSYLGRDFPKYCSRLEELIVPDSVTASGILVIQGMPLLKTVKLSANCSGFAHFDGDTPSIESLDLGSSAAGKLDTELANMPNIKEIKVSSNIKTNITLPETVTAVAIPANVVSKVTNLSSSKVENVTVTGTDSANTITSDIASAIPANATLTIGEGITSVDSAAATTLASNNTTVNVVDSDNSSSISETLSSANVKATTVNQSSNAGVVRATDETGATAFKNTVSGTVGTVNKFTWDVTCNGVTKSFEFEKNSPNLTLGNGASADIALIVKGIASENATAYLTVE